MIIIRSYYFKKSNYLESYFDKDYIKAKYLDVLWESYEVIKFTSKSWLQQKISNI